MAPLSANTMGLKFMQRGNDKAAPPAPSYTKSKPKYARPNPSASTSTTTSKPGADTATTSTSMSIGSSRDMETETNGGSARPRIQKETSLLAFPLLAASYASSSTTTSSFVNPTPGRRSFGKFNKQIESLGKPSVAATPAAKPPESSSGSDSSDDDGASDSSLEMNDAPPPAKRAKANAVLPISGAPSPHRQKAGKPGRPQPPQQGFMRPKGFESQQNGGGSSGKAKRKRPGPVEALGS